MAVYTQTARVLQIETVLGADALLLARIEGEEAVSRPFRFELELASPRMDLDAGALLRTPAAVSFPLHTGAPRTIHGLFSRFAQTGRHEDLATYRAELVAWPWFLSLRRNNRIFQQKSILDIAEEIFRFWGFTDFDFRCDDRPPRDYVVQYNESDLDFVSRWLEAEGVFYYFEHSADRHVLVLADSNGVIEPCPGIAEAWLRGPTPIDMDVITSLTREHAVQVGRVTLRDYDYLQPSLSLEASLEGDGVGEIYDYPASFTVPEDGERYARYRLEAEEARKEQIHGEGNCRWMVSGHSFALHGHFNPATNGEYLITSVRHQASARGFRTGDLEELEYRSSFQCIPLAVPYRPLRITPRPVVKGSQTAVVVGPTGEEVWTDQHGRVKVQFHWDREGKRNEDSSCWVRVATPWGGKGYGSVTIPRIGNEVLIDFLEGDPDLPIIVGSVFNAEQTPPFGLPGAGIQMGMKSRSSPGGGGYNEITATDTKGEEMMNIHAQYDMATTVGNDQTNTINNNRTTSVAVDDTESVGSNQKIGVGADQSLNVAANQEMVVGANRKVTVAANEETSVGASRSASIATNDSVEAGASITQKAGVNLMLDAGAQLGAKAGGSAIIEAPMVTIKSPVIQMGDGTVTIQAGAINLVAGGSAVAITPGGVNITAPSITSTAGGAHTIMGGLVTIN